MKKGFTLIELLAVIVIISITSMIIFPNVTKVINDSKEKLYKSQVMDIEKAADKWASNNLDKLDETHANDVFISLESLRYSGFLEPDQVKNPKDRSVMNGCIRIRYSLDNKKYTFTYEEKSCDDYSNETIDSEEYGSIIYTYDRTSKKYEKNSDHEVLSLGSAIYMGFKDYIQTIGSSNDGLYDMEDEYVFKGSNVNNYITLVGKEGNSTRNSTWRVLSVNKKTNQVKLISASSIASNVWNSGSEIAFKESSLNDFLLTKVNENGIAYYTNKIINNDYSIGTVPSGEFSINALKAALNDINQVDIKSNQKVGTISVLDYVNASRSADCDSNYLSDSCATNNYLKDMFGSSNTTWTLNTNGTDVWYINTSGLLATSTPNNNKQIYAVVTLDSSAYISNPTTGTGTSSNPFIIK